MPPVDHYAGSARSDDAHLAEVGLSVERAHHEVGTAGQAEINYRFDSWPRPPTTSRKFKYVKNGLGRQTTGDFCLPIFGDNGPGMHVHQSLRKDGEPLSHDELPGYGPVRHGALVHRRVAQARTGGAGVQQPDGELPNTAWCSA